VAHVVFKVVWSVQWVVGVVVLGLLSSVGVAGVVVVCIVDFGVGWWCIVVGVDFGNGWWCIVVGEDVGGGVGCVVAIWYGRECGDVELVGGSIIDVWVVGGVGFSGIGV
jgi:hypothetical protein